MKDTLSDLPEKPEQHVLLGTPPRLHRYRWILFLFVAAVLAGAVYVGWKIVQWWEDLLQDYWL